MSRRSWPIVVGGCFRSGTSLLRRMLDGHPRIHVGPEVKFFRDLYGDYLDDPLGHLRFTTTARALAPEAELLDVLGGAFVTLHERAAAQAGKRRWADKNPENVLYLEQWQRLLGGRWLFVHVVRNPLDTLASIKEARFPLTIPASLEDRLALYRRYTEAGLRFAEAQSDRSYRLTYEDLVTTPARTLGSLMAWLGETIDTAQISFNAAPHQEGLEDPKVGATSGVHRRSLGRWRAILTADEARAIWSATRDLWLAIDPQGRYGLPEEAAAQGTSPAPPTSKVDE